VPRQPRARHPGTAGRSSTRLDRLARWTREIRPLEPILFPKLRIWFADFPYLHCSIDQRLQTLETCCGYEYDPVRKSCSPSGFQGTAVAHRTPRRSGCSAGDPTLSPRDAIPGTSRPSTRKENSPRGNGRRLRVRLRRRRVIRRLPARAHVRPRGIGKRALGHEYPSAATLARRTPRASHHSRSLACRAPAPTQGKRRPHPGGRASSHSCSRSGRPCRPKTRTLPCQRACGTLSGWRVVVCRCTAPGHGDSRVAADGPPFPLAGA